MSLHPDSDSNDHIHGDESEFDNMPWHERRHYDPEYDWDAESQGDNQ